MSEFCVGILDMLMCASGETKSHTRTGTIGCNGFVPPIQNRRMDDLVTCCFMLFCVVLCCFVLFYVVNLVDQL